MKVLLCCCRRPKNSIFAALFSFEQGVQITILGAAQRRIFCVLEWMLLSISHLRGQQRALNIGIIRGTDSWDRIETVAADHLFLMNRGSEFSLAPFEWTRQRRVRPPTQKSCCGSEVKGWWEEYHHRHHRRVTVWRCPLYSKFEKIETSCLLRRPAADPMTRKSPSRVHIFILLRSEINFHLSYYVHYLSLKLASSSQERSFEIGARLNFTRSVVGGKFDFLFFSNWDLALNNRQTHRENLSPGR